LPRKNTGDARRCQPTQNPQPPQLEARLTERYGLLLSQSQLAELLGRTIGGLRYSLSNPPDLRTRALKACSRRIGRRVYYPAADVAEIILRETELAAPS
jgi:hypothetical protein